eukprot:scaffold15034_cov138-Isochrysis_galbana.AAC.4
MRSHPGPCVHTLAHDFTPWASEEGRALTVLRVWRGAPVIHVEPRARWPAVVLCRGGVLPLQRAVVLGARRYKRPTAIGLGVDNGHDGDGGHHSDGLPWECG